MKDLAEQPREETALRMYLLGELTEEEQTRQEERLLTDRDHFQRLLLVEQDIIDDYAAGVLSKDEAERIEKYFLFSPSRREKVELARDLRRHACERLHDETRSAGEARPRGSSFIPALAARSPGMWLAVGVLLIVGVVGLLVQVIRVNSEVAALKRDRLTALDRQTQLEQQLSDQLARSRQLARQLEDERSRLASAGPERNASQPPISEPRPRTGLLSLVLDPGRMRDAGRGATVTLPAEAESLTLILNLEQDRSKTYRAALQDAEGDVVWSRNNLKARRGERGSHVVVVMPANSVASGDYTVMLTGSPSQERIGTYYFTVLR